MRQSLKTTHKTRKAPRIARKRAARRAFRGVSAALLLLALAAARAAAITPEAREILAVLESRILSAEAGEASLELFLAALGPGDGCREWEDDAFWKRDPDLKAAMEAVCPDLRRARRRGAPRPQGRFRLTQSLRPLDDEAPSPPPDLAAGLSAPLPGPERPWIGGEGTVSGRTLLRRRLWLGGQDFTLQSGRLAFGPETADPRRPSASRGEGIPHLSFLTGKRGFPGSGWVSGAEGPWEARSPALDGLALTARRQAWQAGGFASWNRMGGADAAEARRDALVYSLGAAGVTGGGPKEAQDGSGWSLQGARLRLEYSGGEPGLGAYSPSGTARATVTPDRSGQAGVAEIWLLGAAVERRVPAGADAEPAGLRTGFALSRLGGEPFRADARSEEFGAYGEVEWRGGTPERGFLALRQATSRWANPLAAVRALTRDTVEGGWILPGRGEGGMILRSRMDLLRTGPWRISAGSGGEADWSLGEGFLAGSGRVTLDVGAGAWEARTSQGLAWRTDALTTYAPPRLHAHSLIWNPGPWRAEAVVSRSRGAVRETWPARLSTARKGQQGNRWTVEAWSGDLRNPLAATRLSCHQAWRLGKTIRILQSLSLPWKGKQLQGDLDARMGLEIAGF